MVVQETSVGRRLGRLLGGVFGRLQPDEEPDERAMRAVDDAIVDCAVYVGGVRQPGRSSYAEAYGQARRRRNAFVWLGLFEPDETLLERVAEVFGLPSLPVDIGPGRRPTVEQHRDVTLLVLRTARYVEHDALTASSEVVDTGAVLLLIGEHFVISVRHGAAGALSHVRSELESRRTLISQGPWSVGYAVCERMVDLYHDVAAQVERDVEELEQTAFLSHGGCDVQQIYQLKRELVEFKRAVVPLQEPLQRLTGAPAGLKQQFADVESRLARAVDRVGSLNELIDSILQARLAQVSIDQNNDMRKIAAWAAIAALQTAIAGIYGMNFDTLPGSRWPYGFAAVLVAMALGGVVLHRLFRRSGWL